MSDSQELDQAYLNALEFQKRDGDGVVRELRGSRVMCSVCVRERRRPRALVRVYEAPEDNSGEVRLWAWLPPHQAAGQEIPARATCIVDRAGEIAWTMSTQCHQCGAWWLVFPGGCDEADLDSLVGRWVGRIHRIGMSHSAPAEPGDRTVAGMVSDERLQGPGGLWLARIERAYWGEIVADTPQ